MKVSVIIPAAGESRRYGGKTKKVFDRLNGRPVFIRSVELFVNRDDVCQTLLVVAEDDMDDLRLHHEGSLGFMGVQVVLGGADRTASVRNALAKVSDQADLICVHDAARPCVSPLWIDEVFAAAAKTGAAILACPLHGTLKRVAPDGKTILETVPRDALWEAQTPQVFRRDILLAAYENASGPATDDAALVEATGTPVTIVPCDARNVKITTPRDMAFAAAVVDALPKPKPVRPAGPFDEARW